jgi:mannan polymerase II complex ANP1 subunit
MGFEVVGLPHYVIWHVYEPSEDDLRRMEEMEKEKEVRGKDVEDVDISKARWEKDRKVIEDILERKKVEKVVEEKGRNEGGGAEGPVAHAGEEGVPDDGGNGITGIEREKLTVRGLESED